MDQRSDNIRQDIESTRAALDTKLDTLESKARETFDLNHQVAERPWMAIGAAVVAGYVLGSLGDDSDQQRWHGQPQTTTDYNQHANQSASQSHAAPSNDRFLAQFDDEIDMLKAAAISTLTNLLHDSVREYLPSMGQQLDRVSQERGVSASPKAARIGTSSAYTPADRVPSSAPNAGYRSGAGQTGFDSPVETNSYTK
jgi:hypothetical protein